MEAVDIIKCAHHVDLDLGILAVAIENAELKERIFGIQAEWRTLAYALSGYVCGVDAESGISPKHQRRRRRKDLPSPENSGGGAQKSTAAPPPEGFEATSRLEG